MHPICYLNFGMLVKFVYSHLHSRWKFTLSSACIFGGKKIHLNECLWKVHVYLLIQLSTNNESLIITHQNIYLWSTSSGNVCILMDVPPGKGVWISSSKQKSSQERPYYWPDHLSSHLISQDRSVKLWMLCMPRHTLTLQIQMHQVLLWHRSVYRQGKVQP